MYSCIGWPLSSTSSQQLPLGDKSGTVTTSTARSNEAISSRRREGCHSLPNLPAFLPHRKYRTSTHRAMGRLNFPPVFLSHARSPFGVAAVRNQTDPHSPW